MTFREWLYGGYPPNSAYAGQWKWAHVLTLLLSVAVAVALACIFRKKKRTVREIVVKTLAVLILTWEVAWRIVSFAKGDANSLQGAISMLLPQSWGAFALWIMIIAAVCNKKSVWNFAAINGLLCSCVYFAYPTAGFSHTVYAFNDVYVIATRALTLIASISILTLSLGDFRYRRDTFTRGILTEIILFACMFAYAFALTVFLKTPDPMYFAQAKWGLPYAVYLALYVVGLLVWVNAFYVIPILWNKWIRKGKVRIVAEKDGVQKSGRYLTTKKATNKKK